MSRYVYMDAVRPIWLKDHQELYDGWARDAIELAGKAAVGAGYTPVPDKVPVVRVERTPPRVYVDEETGKESKMDAYALIVEIEVEDP